jgi:cell wall-associated NlpC family hydrolase
VAAVVQAAMGLQGIPYRDGGADPSGFDCSGFTQYVFAQAGAQLPREVRDQFKVGQPVERGAQQPGDLVFFATTSPAASHVGIVIGDDEFVHAPSSRGVVRVERMSVPYWSRRFVGFRRLTGD